MGRLRTVRPASTLQPEGPFIRALQGPFPNHIKFEENTGRYVVSSQAFRPSTTDHEVSGDLGQLLKADGLSPTALYPAVERAPGAVAVLIETIRGAGCEVEHSPMLDNWYHGGIVGVGRHKNNKIKRKISDASFEVVPIDQEEARRQHDEVRAEVERTRAMQSF